MNTSEAIQQIETYGAKYDPDSDLSVWEQLEICQSIAESEKRQSYYHRINDKYNNATVNGNVNDTYKQHTGFVLSPRKQEVIIQLRLCNYRTPIYKVADLLEELFAECESRQGHWSFIAQNYSPRAINRVIHRMIKLHGEWKTVRNPAALFTYLIQFRKRRRGL